MCSARILQIGVVLGLLWQSAPALGQETALPSSSRCAASSQQRQAAGMMGALAGGVAANAFTKSKFKAPAGFASAAGAALADVLVCNLSHKEQAQDERATLQAVELGVGGTSTWMSETRSGVMGTSTVAAEKRQEDGSICRVVSDVVIINGEESTVDKRLCRSLGGSGFMTVASR